MYCFNCGKEIDENAMFCRYCGTYVNEDEYGIDTNLAADGAVQTSTVNILNGENAVHHHRKAKRNVTRNRKTEKKSTCCQNPWIPRFISICMIVVGVVALATFMVSGRSTIINLKKAKTGDIVTFGHYEQDGNFENGKEPIEWVILDESTDRLLLISKYVLDCMPYNDEIENVTWESCLLRKWLNKNFYKEAFSQVEKYHIQNTRVINTDNAFFGSAGGEETQDKVFLLSIEEIRKYYSFNTYSETDMFGNSESLIPEVTEYAKYRGVYTLEITEEVYNSLNDEGYSPKCIGREGCSWWLRSPSNADGAIYTANLVTSFGRAGANINNTITYCAGIRPALFVNK